MRRTADLEASPRHWPSPETGGNLECPRPWSDTVTVKDWFINPVQLIEIIRAGNGKIWLNAQVGQIIRAMAGFTTQTGLSWDAAAGGAGTAEQQSQFQSILATNWQ